MTEWRNLLFVQNLLSFKSERNEGVLCVIQIYGKPGPPRGFSLFFVFFCEIPTPGAINWWNVPTLDERKSEKPRVSEINLWKTPHRQKLNVNPWGSPGGTWFTIFLNHTLGSFFPKISKSPNSPKNGTFKNWIFRLIFVFSYLRKFSKVDKKFSQKVSKWFNSCRYDVFKKLICEVNCGHFASLRIFFTNRMGFDLRSLTSMPLSSSTTLQSLMTILCFTYYVLLFFSCLTCGS